MKLELWSRFCENTHQNSLNSYELYSLFAENNILETLFSPTTFSTEQKAQISSSGQQALKYSYIGHHGMQALIPFVPHNQALVRNAMMFRYSSTVLGSNGKVL